MLKWEFSQKTKLESIFDCFLILLDPNSYWIVSGWRHQNFPEIFTYFPKNLKSVASWLWENTVWGIRITAGANLGPSCVGMKNWAKMG